MILNIVIISHNQEKFLERFPIEITKKCLFVLDRCSDNSEEICKKNSYKYIKNQQGFGFLAGFARQMGVDFFGTGEPIFFLDGDKIPNGDLQKIENLLKDGFDCVLLGVKDDPRKYEKNIELVHDKTNPHNGVYSCGIVLSPRLMGLCSETSSKGRVWHEDFDGRWGEEDRWIGDVAIFNDLKICFSDDVVLSGVIGGMEGHEDDFVVNTMKRLELRKRLGFEF